jgi:Rrf2 family transcriptional regulator, iron-sulfur cluster assembly transcription factor
MLSKSCLYGIQAALYLAAHDRAGYVSIRQIGQDLGISYFFLTKVLQRLTEKGIMTSFRGPNGGVALHVSAKELTLKQLIVALDGPGMFVECVLGLPGCGSEKPCPLHADWGVVRQEIETTLAGLTVSELALRWHEPEFAFLNNKTNDV